MTAEGGASRVPPLLAVSFDLGETLYHYGDLPLSWIESSRAALEAVADALGVPAEPERIDDAKEILKTYDTNHNPRVDEVDAQDVLAEVLEHIGADATEHVNTAVDVFFRFFRQDLEAYPDAIVTLAKLKRRGFMVGVLSNVPYGMPHHIVQEDLERTGLAPFVDALVTSADIGKRKPDPAGYLWLAGLLGVETAAMAYVGNADTDIEGALAVGAWPVLVDRVYRPSDYGQAATIASLRELPALLGSPVGAGAA